MAQKKTSITKKSKADKLDTLISGIAGIKAADVLDHADCGRFILVQTQKEIIFHTYLGLETRIAPWITDMSGNATHGTLWLWLANLIYMHHETEKHKGEPFPESGTTYDDILDSEIWMTWLLLAEGVMSAFSDGEAVAKASEIILARLTERIKELEAAAGEASEETEDSVKAEYEDGQKAVMTDRAAEYLTEGDNEL